MYTCPCCGFVVFNTPTGGYELCPTCDWEDDNVQLRHSDIAGGANGESLWEAQQVLVERIPVSVKSKDKFMRDKRWRPLNEEEVVNIEPKPLGVRNTTHVPLTDDGEKGWVLAQEDPLNTLDYYWLRHN